MHYGFYLPTRGPTATRDGVLALAREGERLGLHSAMVADHIVFPVESESIYPYTLDRKHPGGGDALEAFSILGVVAGATERLRLVTSVLVLPYRNPVLTARIVASLDVLCGGQDHAGRWRWLAERGIRGTGQSRVRQARRGYGRVDRDLQATLDALARQLHWRALQLFQHPLGTAAVQKPHPPIWVGGHSRAALRRTARHGDGWHPVGAIAASPLPPQETRAHLDTLRRLTEAEGRDFSALTISYKAPLDDSAVPDRDGRP